MSEQSKGDRLNAVPSGEELPETILLTIEELRALEAATSERAERPATNSRGGTAIVKERPAPPSDR